MINYPTSLDSLSNPVSTDQVANADPLLVHSRQHRDANDAIEALEAKVGVNSSAVITSHDYKLGEVISSDKAVGKTATQTLDNKTLTAPKIINNGYIADANGNEQVEMVTVASAVNNVRITNASTGNAPILDANGSDSNIDLNIRAKGSGSVKLGTAGIKFPNTDGTATYMLTTNGLGQLGFTAQPVAATVVPFSLYTDITGSSNESVYSQYCDSLQLAIATRSGTTFNYYNSLISGGPQTRDVTSDWASATEISSQVTIGSYVYIFMRDGSNNYRIYRYGVGTLSSGGTLMTISGQAFSTTGGANVYMTSNGTNFYFNYKGGNNASDRIISKYSISGTTLTYVSDITCGASSNVCNQIAYVDSSDNIYGYYRSVDFGGDNKIRKYNSSGVLQYTTVAYSSSGSWRAVFTYATSTYLERYVNTGASSHNNVFYFNKMSI